MTCQWPDCTAEAVAKVKGQSVCADHEYQAMAWLDRHEDLRGVDVSYDVANLTRWARSYARAANEFRALTHKTQHPPLRRAYRRLVAFYQKLARQATERTF